MLTGIKRMPPLLLVIALAFAVVSCVQEEPAPQGEELTQEEIEQILADAATATAEVDTCKFDADMAVTINATGGEQIIEAKLAINTTGVIDKVNREMQTTMDMTQEAPGGVKTRIATEFYLVGEWAYAKLKVLNLVEQWGKTGLTEEMWNRLDMVGGQVELLTSPVEVNFLGSEDISGVPCYVLQLMPTTAALSSWLNQQQLSGVEKIDWVALNLDKIFKEWSYKCWIAKDSYLLVKLEADMLLEMSPDEVGASPEDFEEETINIALAMIVYDHNTPVAIVLPEAALEAPEMDIN
jgi:outer membrane lipoprotein-sorting protein